MNVKIMGEFLIDKTLLPGYRIELGMKIVPHRTWSEFGGCGPVRVVKIEENFWIHLREVPSRRWFKIPLTRIHKDSVISVVAL